MTQSSYPQAGYLDPVARRDSGPYTATEWRAWMLTGIPSGGVIVAGGAVRTLASLTNLGVFYAVPNRLAVTNPGAAPNTLQIDTGASICGGFFHYNDTAVTLTVPNNLASEIIVVRQNFGLGTYTPIGSVDADEQVPPSTARITRVPSLTQDVNLATFWDIPLMTFSTGAAGAVTLESDDREYADADTIEFLVPAVGGRNITDGTNVNQEQQGCDLENTKICYATGFFKIPTNYISDLTTTAVYVSSGAGNIDVFNYAGWAECNEAVGTHTDRDPVAGYSTIAPAGANFNSCVMPLDISPAVPGDIVALMFQRDGNDASAATVWCTGWIIQYLGWRSE